MVKGILPAIAVQRLKYLRRHGKFPNLQNPRTFTEKVFRRKLFERNPLFTECTDKLLVRPYVSERVGSDVLVPLLFQTHDPERLYELDTWANTVIKANHGWRMMEIISDQEPGLEEKARVISECRKWLATEHAGTNSEYHYIGITPAIMVERFVGSRHHAPLDCKVHCFRQLDGSVKSAVQLVADRFEAKAMTYYLGGLEEGNIVRTFGAGAPRIEPSQRALIADALNKSEVLCRDFDYVSVDWMITSDRIYFSELTFTPGAGLSSSMGAELDRKLGEFWVKPAADV